MGGNNTPDTMVESVKVGYEIKIVCPQGRLDLGSEKKNCKLDV